ncbi:hypothetical protein Tco_1554796 [Tanacetum coccineum]
MHEQAHSSRNRLAQLNVMILEMETMNDPKEFYDALFCLRDEYNTLMAIIDVIAKVEEKLTIKEAYPEIMEAEINPDWSLDEDLHLGNAFADDMPIMDKVVFKIHKNGYFEFDPLRFEVIHTDNDVHSFCADAESLW